ncbi:hypothetical protein HKCCE3408_00185 [Rhodobacterales bacterium HKCCE3408]|nr:hypothetical protein [Rhodobacterales bacterium HKCCE3408]
MPRHDPPAREGFLVRFFGGMLRDLVHDLLIYFVGGAGGAIAGGAGAFVWDLPLWGMVLTGAVAGFFGTIFLVNFARGD